MGLFKITKEKPDVKPAVKYSQIEQGMAKSEEPVPAAPQMPTTETYLMKIDQVLANQVTIAENEVLIVEEVRKCQAAIAWIQDQIRNQGGEEVEEEPTEEEIQEAIAEARKKKASSVKVKKK